MKTLIVGGDFGITPKKSKIIELISNNFENKELINGGTLSELPHEINNDLIIWMPNISNEETKQYPIKSIGNVLIVSKVIRDGYTDLDAVSRIFKMNGNAVIAIYKEEKIRFKLIDSLGNVWYNDNDINGLCSSIKIFYDFTKKSVRCRTNKIEKNTPELNNDIKEFIEINKSLAIYIQNSCGNRFFGNLSTRCSKLFPTIRNVGIWVSPRNSNKEFIIPEDMIYCEYTDNVVYYVGDKKPSVDSPVQLKIYENCEQINYMIHGHAFIKNAKETENYFLCGDMREADDVIHIIDKNDFGAINLTNHGFLLYSNNLENLKKLISTLEFAYERKDILF